MKKMLVVVTNIAKYQGVDIDRATGLWLGEAVHFVHAVEEKGYQVDFVSPNGGAIPLDERSMKAIYLDKAAKSHLANPVFRQKLNNTLGPTAVNATDYKAIYYTGGHGTMWDFPNNQALANIAQTIYQQGGVVSAVCHGVGGLLFVKDNNGNSLITNHHVTGYANVEEVLSNREDQLPFLLQDALLQQGAHYHKALIPFTSYVIKDDRLITGQNPQSSTATGRAVIERLAQIK